jgi:hypothetical protein
MSRIEIIVYLHDKGLTDLAYRYRDFVFNTFFDISIFYGEAIADEFVYGNENIPPLSLKIKPVKVVGGRLIIE